MSNGGLSKARLGRMHEVAIPDRDHHSSEQEVLEVAALSGQQFRRFVRGIVAAMWVAWRQQE